MAATTERAILAGGCFWEMQQLVRRLPGVSTRVGYSGGDVKNANVPQPRHARGSDRDHVRSEPDELPRPAGVFLPHSTTRRAGRAAITIVYRLYGER